jgi:hypothetical protein
MEEVWKDVVGYEGLYLVSNLGNVKRVRNGKLVASSDNGCGYMCVSLGKKGEKRRSISIHLLVIRSFVGPAPVDENGVEYQCDHKDGNKKNNQISNLEYVTRAENIKRSHQLPGRRPKRRKNQGSGSLSLADLIWSKV